MKSLNGSMKHPLGPHAEAMPQGSRHGTENMVKIILAASLTLLAVLLVSGHRASLVFRDLPVLALPGESHTLAPADRVHAGALSSNQEVPRPAVQPPAPATPALLSKAVEAAPEHLDTLWAKPRRWKPEMPPARSAAARP